MFSPGVRSRAAPLALAALSCTCASPERAPDDRPHILVVMLDTTGARRVGAYGYAAPTTPHLDAFARNARVFERALSTSNWTLPSHASFFTGLYPRLHGATGRDGWLEDRFATLAEQLRDGGYETFLFSANPYVSGEHNLAQGFETAEYAWEEPWQQRVLATMEARRYEQPVTRSRFVPFKDAGEAIREGFFAWEAARDRERPFFAFLNFMEAHRPWYLTREERRRFLDDALVERSYALDHSYAARFAWSFGLGGYEARDLAAIGGLYDAAIRRADEVAGALLAELERRDLARRTVVVVVSDHGDSAGEHGLLGHEYSLYDTLLRVPLVIRHPELFPPGRVAEPVQLVDLYPTLLGVAGVALAPGHPSQGRDLRALDAAAARERPLVGEYLDPNPRPLDAVAKRRALPDRARWLRRLRSIQLGADKLIWAEDGRHELYDLEADPREQRDLARAEPARVAALLEALAAWDTAADALAAGDGASARRAPLGSAQRRRLESLGYLEEGAAP